MPSPEGGEPFVMSYVVDESKTPHNIDFNIESGPVPQGKALGIFKLEDGKMTLIYDPDGTESTRKFRIDRRQWLFDVRDEKMAKGADPDVNKKLVGTWVFKSGKQAGSEVAKDRLQIIVDITKRLSRFPPEPMKNL